MTKRDLQDLVEQRLQQFPAVALLGPRQVVRTTLARANAVVAIPSHEADEPFSLSAQDEDDLLAAMAKIERGEFVSAKNLLESLPKHG